MVGRPLRVVFLALVSVVAAEARQPVTAQGAVEAAEKLEPKTSPLDKVVSLLKDLIVKVEDEGKKEAAAYDKYACFCKEQADGKLYQNDTSTEKVQALAAEIGELGSAITALNQDVADLSTYISDKEKAIKEKTEDREKEHAEYQEKDADVVSAVDACERAIEALKESKKAMEGKADTEAALSQVRKVMSKAAAFIVLSDVQARLLGPTDGQAYESSYHSNDIIETLENLKDQFIDVKNRQDKTEFESKEVFEKEKLGLTNEAKFAQQEKDEKEMESAKKTERKEEATKERDLEETARIQDMEFLNVLTHDCEAKAATWDQRSKTRADELKALGDAIQALETGAAPNYKANRRLNDLEIKAVAKGVKKVLSFLQLSGAGGRNAQRRDKVLQILDGAGKKLSSPVLMMAAVKVRAAEDHFVKVRALIKDLITRLENQAEEEATAKEKCDEMAKQGVSDRDEAQSKKEEADKDLEIAKNKVTQLTSEIAELSEGIAANNKALLEASELRNEEKVDNEEVRRQALAGKAEVDQAIKFLENFYNNAFIQKGKYEPFRSANSNRDGKTVADLAPEVFDDTYHGQQEASKGIIGMLQVISSDFDRTDSSTADREEASEEAFIQFETKNKEDTKAKEKLKGEKETEKGTQEEAVLTQTDASKDASKDVDLAVKHLDTVHSMCVEPDESYEERGAKRDQEVEALKQAHAILEDWESQ